MEHLPFERTHIDSFLDSADREGWITSMGEMEFLLGQNPAGCFVARHDGVTVGFITSIRYDRSAWIGNLIVRAGYRGRGLGRALMARVLQQLDKASCETVWLTASADGAPLYRTLGFTEIDRIFRWKRPGALMAAADEPVCSETFARIDSAGWGDDRGAVLGYMSDASCMLTGQRGFIVSTRLPGICTIGPWGAVSADRAEQLFDSMLVPSGAAGVTVLDVPEQNLKAAGLLTARGFSPAGSTLLMYRGGKPLYRPELVFALASLGSYG